MEPNDDFCDKRPLRALGAFEQGEVRRINAAATPKGGGVTVPVVETTAASAITITTNIIVTTNSAMVLGSVH